MQRNHHLQTGRSQRYAGQSLDAQFNDIFDTKILFFVMFTFVVSFLAVMEWWRFYSKEPPQPIIYTVFAVAIAAFSFFRIKKLFRKAKFIALGRDGERVVGQFLEDLRKKGCRVFHDIVGKDFNLDHVVLSEKGIFVIETKTYSKPRKGECKIVYDGSHLRFQGEHPTDKPLIQVTAASKWLRDVLKESTGKDFQVKPVVVFPGWYVESTGAAKNSNIWVLNPKALPKFIENQPDSLKTEDMKLASFHISRYIRSKAG